MKYTISSEGYRPINIALLENGLIYSAGATEVYVKSVNNNYRNNGYRLNRPIEYNVSILADKIQHQPYRRSRRHYEILEFLEKAVDSLKLDRKKDIFVTNTDGSSRVTAINAITASLILEDAEKVPVAISFGQYANELVFDLDYVQDSGGTGDCAVAFIVTAKTVHVSYLLYEGTMCINKFLEGLATGTAYAIGLTQKLKTDLVNLNYV